MNALYVTNDPTKQFDVSQSTIYENKGWRLTHSHLYNTSDGSWLRTYGHVKYDYYEYELISEADALEWFKTHGYTQENPIIEK